MRSRVHVRKSSPVLIRPSSSSPLSHGGCGESISLLPCDRAFVGVPNTALLVYSEPIHGPAESIKCALSRALVHYHPLAGRILRATADADHGGEEAVYIACIGEGVSFVAATSSASVEDVLFFNETIDAASGGATWLDDLAAYYPCPDGDRPLVLMQVTEFSCGGYVVGVTWNHGAADGAGMGQFIKAVGDLARGLKSPSVLPVTRSLDPALDTVFLDINVPASTIDRVRARCGDGQRTVTVFEAVTAVLWQCHTRATMSVDPEAGASETPTVLCFSVDLRRYAGAKDGYYGNCITLQRAPVTGGEVAGGAITEVVRVIQNAKDRIQVTDTSEKQRKLEEMEHLFIVTYWRNLGLDDADFVGGKPARVLSCMRGAVGPPVNIVTGNGEDGGCNVLSRCLKEHAQAFLHQLAAFNTY